MTTEIKQWENKYHECLALEFSNPSYFEVHHLLVLTFMLQTDAYSIECYTFAKELLRSFLNNTITTDEFRNQFKSIGKITKSNFGSNNEEIKIFDWNLNILSIRIDSSEHYIKDVYVWAKDVLKVIDNYNQQSNARM